MPTLSSANPGAPSRPWRQALAFASRSAPVLAAAVSLATLTASLHAQQTMGTVATHDALVTGGLEVHADRAQLLSNASITAYADTAPIALARGGQVLVCATSQFHLLHSGLGPSLFFGLDRGAIEIHSPTSPQDVILTPDLRFTLESPGQLNLSLRVTRNGDTCVDNHGVNAPTLLLNDPFSSAVYRLTPNQHVLFEHGSLREVVDNESSSCGCPAPTLPPPQIATAAPTDSEAPALISPQTATPTPAAASSTPSQLAAQAAAEHPFPAAVSEDLAPPQSMPNSTPTGETQTQISATLSYGTNPNATPAPKPAPATTATLNGSPTGSGSDTSPPPPKPPGFHDLAHAIGHFFHKLFHPHS